MESVGATIGIGILAHGVHHSPVTNNNRVEVPPAHPPHLIAFPHAYQRKPVAHATGFFFSRRTRSRLYGFPK